MPPRRTPQEVPAGKYVYTGGQWTRAEENADGVKEWVTYHGGDIVELTAAEATRLGPSASTTEIRRLTDEEKAAGTTQGEGQGS